jgi:hypothetical protein
MLRPAHQDDHLYQWLVHCAETGQVAPSNAAIAHDMGFKSGSGGSYGIERLEKQGRISVFRFKKSRVIVITATGQATAKPQRQEARKCPHPPAEVDRVLEMRRANLSCRTIADALSLGEKQVRGIIERNRELLRSQMPDPIRKRPQLMAIGPSKSCTFITGDDFLQRLHRGEVIHCSLPSVPGTSWCPSHFQIVAPPEIQPASVRAGH